MAWANSTSRLRRLIGQARGHTAIELITTVTVFGIVAGTAIPHFKPKQLYIINAQRLVIANLRVARTNAISKCLHFQVSFPTAGQLRVSRMMESPADSGTWVVDDTVTPLTVPLPSGTTVKTATVGTNVEFNSRGIAVNLSAVRQIDVQDTFSATKSLQVWPSGQVNET